MSTAPDRLREPMRRLPRARLVATCAALRPGAAVDASAATKHALRSIARRVQALDAEIASLDALLGPLVASVAPALLELHALGTDTAGALLVAAGDNPERLRNEAAFAKLCGAAPLPASSGKTTRHRLDRGGDRQANSALWRVVLIRMRTHEPTRAYVARRLAEGLTKKEVIRCLKRYVAREVYAHLPQVQAARAAASANRRVAAPDKSAGQAAA